MSSEQMNINGNEYDPEVVSTGLQILSANARGITPTSGGIGGADISSDGSISRWNGYQYGGERDIYDVLGYDDLDDNTALEKYRQRYNRQDIAERVVDIFPEETWKEAPTVEDDGEEETEFERVANKFIESTLVHYLKRTDRAQRLGEYGLLMIGFDDGQALDQPVQESAINSVDDISFFNVFPQEQVESWTLGKDMDGDADEAQPNHERYNKPVEYRLDFGDIDAGSADDDFKTVHYTRVIHVAEGALETDLKGPPALKPIFNRLIDREKVIGASAEMFYTGADRKIIANVADDFALKQYSDTGEREDFKSQLSRVINDLQQTMVSTGMEFEVLGGQEVDPSGVVDQIDASIAANTGIPKNKLQGNEMGERSTTQDRHNWFDTIKSRQTNFAGPKMLKPLIDRLIEFGVLTDPSGDYRIVWPDLIQKTQMDIAELQSQRSNALASSQLSFSMSSADKLKYIQEGPDALEIEEVEEQPLPERAQTQQAFEEFNSLNQDIDNVPPQTAQENAQKVLRWREEHPDEIDGMTEVGWRRARQLADGGELSDEVIKKMAQFNRHRGNSGVSEEYRGEPWKDAGHVAWLGWGGDAGINWAIRQSEKLTENQNRYQEGDTVDTPDGKGVVVDAISETFKDPDENEIKASPDSPSYAVLVESDATPLGFYKASDLSAIDPDDLADVENPEEDVKEVAENYANNSLVDVIAAYLSGNQEGHFNWPESWDKSPQPARLIALKAFAGMGGSFDGCVREMRGNIVAPERFCADFIDRLVGNPYWRGDSWAPGD